MSIINMGSRRDLLQAGLFFATAGAAMSTLPKRVFAQTSKPIRIGWFAGLSGPVAAGGLAQDAGTKAAVEELNKAGGVLGRMIELVIRDTVGDPGKAMNFAQELLFREKVDVLFGPTGSAETFPVRDVSKEAGTVQFTTAQIDSVIDAKAYPNLFRLDGSTGNQLDYGLGYALNTLKRSKIALLVDNLSYGLLSRDLAVANMKARGVAPAYVGVVDQNKVDMGADILNARASGADLMLTFTASSGFMARILTAHGEQKWDVPVIAAPLSLSATVNDLVKPEYLGSVMGLGYRHLSLGSDGKFNPAVEKLITDHADYILPQVKNGLSWAILGYSTTKLWAQAAIAAGSTESKSVIGALEGMSDVPTTFGRISLSPTRHDGLPLDEFALFRADSQRHGGYTAV